MVPSGTLRDLTNAVSNLPGSEEGEVGQMQLVEGLLTLTLADCGVSTLTLSRLLYDLGQSDNAYNSHLVMVAYKLVSDAELITTTSRLRLAEGLGMWASFSGTFSRTLWEGWDKAEGAALAAARLVVRECRERLGRDVVDKWLEGFSNLSYERELESFEEVVGKGYEEARAAVAEKEWR